MREAHLINILQKKVCFQVTPENSLTYKVTAHTHRHSLTQITYHLNYWKMSVF